MESLKIRDRKAFDYLYDNYSSAIFGLLVKMLEDEEQAKDLLQDVFIKIWKNIDQLDLSKGRLFTWILNITRNAAIDVLRSSKYKHQKRNPGLDNFVSNEADPSATLQIDSIGLKNIISEMPDDFRNVLDLAYFKGFTQDEISKELNIPLGTVKTRCRNALLLLKKIFRR